MGRQRDRRCGSGDGKREKLKWKRFAAGLYEPLGLRIVNDVVYVRGRDQITRLHDLNADGEADFYECFNNDGVVSANYHGFAMDLQTDAAGNFYYTRCGQRMHPELPGQGVADPREPRRLEVRARRRRLARRERPGRRPERRDHRRPTTRATGRPPAGSTSSSPAGSTATCRTSAPPAAPPAPTTTRRSAGSR